MALGTSTPLANTRLDATTEQCDNGYIRFYDGVRPATANVAVSSQVKLAELRWAATAFTAASGASAAANAITPSTVIADGTCTWFRSLKADGATVLFDGNVGTSGSDCNFNTVAFATGAAISLTSVTLTQSL
jgi:hypothetical protein